MIGSQTTTVDHTRRVTDEADRAAFRNLGKAIFTIAGEARQSITVDADPSDAGAPPHTRKGRKLPRAIRYDNDKARQSAIAGPMFSMAGESGAFHEFGETHKGQDFDERAFMGPALEKNVDRFAGDWAGSIG